MPKPKQVTTIEQQAVAPVDVAAPRTAPRMSTMEAVRGEAERENPLNAVASMIRCRKASVTEQYEGESPEQLRVDRQNMGHINNEIKYLEDTMKEMQRDIQEHRQTINNNQRYFNVPRRILYGLSFVFRFIPPLGRFKKDYEKIKEELAGVHEQIAEGETQKLKLIRKYIDLDKKRLYTQSMLLLDKLLLDIDKCKKQWLILQEAKLDAKLVDAFIQRANDLKSQPIDTAEQLKALQRQVELLSSDLRILQYGQLSVQYAALNRRFQAIDAELESDSEMRQVLKQRLQHAIGRISEQARNPSEDPEVYAAQLAQFEADVNNLKAQPAEKRQKPVITADTLHRHER